MQTMSTEHPETEESLTAVRALIRIIKKEKEVRKSLSKTDPPIETQFEIRTIQNNLDPMQENEKLAILSQFRKIISIQLPEIPKEYLTRLIFDDRHLNHILLEFDVGVRGGICCRKFENFLEIAFCAVTTTEQLKGYGTMLMDFLKDWMLENDCYHAVTYADEYAVEWFRKKGFTENPQLDPKFYKNRIKEYVGATLMGFDIDSEYLFKKYPNLSKQIRILYKASMNEEEEEEGRKTEYVPSPGRVYRGIEQVFKEDSLPLQLSQIPGARTLNILNDPQYQLGPVDAELDKKIRWILGKLGKESESRPFREPVDAKVVPDYYQIIRNPIDLKTIKERWERGYYCHQHLFIADLTRMFKNCYTFNGENTIYYRYGYKLNEVALVYLKSAFPDSKLYPEMPEKKPKFYI